MGPYARYTDPFLWGEWMGIVFIATAVTPGGVKLAAGWDFWPARTEEKD